MVNCRTKYSRLLNKEELTELRDNINSRLEFWEQKDREEVNV